MVKADLPVCRRMPNAPAASSAGERRGGGEPRGVGGGGRAWAGKMEEPDGLEGGRGRGGDAGFVGREIDDGDGLHSRHIASAEPVTQAAPPSALPLPP